jgi:hypothetical protein
VTANPANSPIMALHDALMDTPAGVTLSDLTLWWEGAAFNGGQIAATARGATDHVLAQYRDAEFPLNRIFVPVNELKPDHYDLPSQIMGLGRGSTCPEGAGTCQTNVVALLAVHRPTLTAFARCRRARLQSTRCWRWG